MERLLTAIVFWVGLIAFAGAQSNPGLLLNATPTPVPGHSVTIVDRFHVQDSGAVPSVGANPTAQVGASAVNGSAATFMRSDAAPPLAAGAAATNVGPLGGDLSGTLPNPTVAKIGGKAIDLTGTVDGDIIYYVTTSSKYIRGAFTTVQDYVCSVSALRAGCVTVFGYADPTWWGAVGDCTITNDAAAWNSAINALPVNGGRMRPRAGCYGISATIEIGNGTSSLASSRVGIKIEGISGGTTDAEMGPSYGGVTLNWIGASAPTTAMMHVAGPIPGVTIEGIYFRANALAGICVDLDHPINGYFHNAQCDQPVTLAYRWQAYTYGTGAAVGSQGNTFLNFFNATRPASGSSGAQIGALDYGPSFYATSITSIANAGTGYAVNDTITLTGGTFVRAAVIKVTGIGGGGAITSAVINPYGGGYSVFPSNPVAQGSTSGAGTGATFNLTSGNLAHLDIAQNNIIGCRLYADGATAGAAGLILGFVDVVHFDNCTLSYNNTGTSATGLKVVPPTGNLAFPANVTFSNSAIVSANNPATWTAGCIASSNPYGIKFENFHTGDSEVIPVSTCPGGYYGTTDTGVGFGGYLGTGEIPTIASAATTNVSFYRHQLIAVTGTTPVQFLGSSAPIGTVKTLLNTSALTYVNSASLILPGGENLAALINSYTSFVYVGSGVWAWDGRYAATNGQPPFVTGTGRRVLATAPTVTQITSNSAGFGGVTAVAPATKDSIRIGQDNINYYPIGRSTTDGYLYFQGTQAAAKGYVFDEFLSTTTKIRASGTAPALTSCGGGSPAISGSDLAGEVTMGTTATGCVITFNVAYAATPYCVVTWQATPLVSQSYAVSTTAITLTQTSTSGNKVNYVCFARSGG